MMMGRFVRTNSMAPLENVAAEMSWPVARMLIGMRVGLGRAMPLAAEARNQPVAGPVERRGQRPARLAGLLVVTGLIVTLLPTGAWAAIGCTLNNPAQDLKFLYPEVTSFKEEIREFRHLSDGSILYAGLKERLGSDLDPVYESFDTPYTVYSVFKGDQLIGIVHGVNVPGKGGVIQVFLSMDPGSGEIRDFFFQRLESRAARALRDKAFRARFKGLTLADFYKHDYFSVADPTNPADRLAGIQAPGKDPDQVFDFQASLRGIRKNLILLDLFVYDRRFEPFHQRTRDLLAGKKPAE